MSLCKAPTKVCASVRPARPCKVAVASVCESKTESCSKLGSAMVENSRHAGEYTTARLPCCSTASCLCKSKSNAINKIKQLSAAMIATAAITVSAPAFAGVGEEVFDGNCAACHAGGANSVDPSKPLEKSAIAANLGAFEVDKIIYQIQNGKNGMPAWKDALEPDEIEAVANYVYDNAANDSW